jgi:hypothetical protein
LGKNWQRDYIVWDMCCGVGNLQVKHSNPRNIYMSTLDEADVDVMKATKTCVAATRFQYDYLNDDITDDGQIDYSLTNKIPQGLRDAIAQGKKILVLINPPYAEVGSGADSGNKAGVAKTKIAATMMNAYGKASNELFTQFVARIANEIPNATLAMFSKLKYVNAPNFEKFREAWNAKYLDGFIVHSKAFDGLNGNFPIGFLIWKTDNRHLSSFRPNEAPSSSFRPNEESGGILDNSKKGRSLDYARDDEGGKDEAPSLSSQHPILSSQRRLGSHDHNALDSGFRRNDKKGRNDGVGRNTITEISTEIIDKKGNPIGEKRFYNLPNNSFLNVWIDRPKRNSIEIIPLKNGIAPATSKPRVDKWSNNAISYMYCGKNDLQHANQQTVVFSSAYGQGDGFYVTPENLWQAAIVFSVRRLIKPTWINDRDQFLQPTEQLSDDFKNDCLIWMLFNGSNLTASADGLEWNGRTWSIVNHFIPFTESDVNAPDRFESDFMVQYLQGKKLSPESIAVLNAGRDLWRAYFAHTDPHTVRDELKLNRADVGWYQIRNALKKRNESGDYPPVDFGVFETAYKNLSEKLRPMVYDLGFLKP